MFLVAEMDGREARGRVCVCLVRRRLRLPIEGSSRNAMVSGDVGFGRAEGYSWWSSSQKFVKSRRQNVDPVRALAGQGPEFVSLIGWLPSPSLDRWKLHCPCPRLPDKARHLDSTLSDKTILNVQLFPN